MSCDYTKVGWRIEEKKVQGWFLLLAESLDGAV